MATTTSPARQIKSALTKAFPGTKFSVTTNGRFNGSVYVSWEMDLGLKVTYDAVSAIAKPFDTQKNLADPYEDYYNFVGFSISLCPKFSEAREDWAAKCVSSEWNVSDASWNKDRKEFQDSKGFRHYHASNQFDNYLKNGVADALADEYGREPIEKSWYYERQNQNQKVEQVPAKTEIEVEETTEEIILNSIPKDEKKLETFLASSILKPIIPLSVEVSSADILLDVQYSYANKQSDLEGYLESMEEEDGYQMIKTFVSDITTLTESDYDKFTSDLWEKHEWMKNRGGSSVCKRNKTKSPAIIASEGDFYNAIQEDIDKENHHFLSLIVTDGNRFIFVNPHGCDNARYVGFSSLSLQEIRDSLGLSPVQEPDNEQQEKIEEILSARRDRWEEKQEQKIESYERLKVKHEQLSDSNYKAFKDISKMIPFGQPILVGHHSEARHRRDAKKIHSYMGKSIQHQQTAEYYADKLKWFNSDNVISSDDPDAIAKLEAKLTGMQVR